ncbi:MAG: MFS transporter [Candidatus Hydrogenedentes bacterium]|nr:MFS transporter [Candidatus Hydrogenedentota bacterium]
MSGTQEPVTRMQRIIDFFVFKRGMVGLLAMVILVAMGEKMAERFLPLYLTALGGGALAVGLLGYLDNQLSAIYSFFGGYIGERLGMKRALRLFNFMAMLGYVLVIAVPSWPTALIGAMLFLSWTAISLPATMDLVSGIAPKNKRAMGVTMHSLVKRIPMAIGPLVGGYCIDYWGRDIGMRIAFGVALAMTVLALVLQERLIHETSPRAQRRAELNPFNLMPLMNSDLRNLLMSDILVRFCEQIPAAFVVIWCCDLIANKVTAAQFGWLTTIEMATAVLCYVPVAYWADRLGKKPFVVMTFVFFTLFPVVLLYSQSFWPLAGAFIIRGLKEFGEPTRKALIMDLAPEDRKAAVFGLYYLLRDVIVAFAAGGGAVLWWFSPALNLWAAFAFGVAGTVYFIVRGRDVKIIVAKE